LRTRDQPRISTEYVFTEEQTELARRAQVLRRELRRADGASAHGVDPPFDPGMDPAAPNSRARALGGRGRWGCGGTLVDQSLRGRELGAALACGPSFGTVVPRSGIGGRSAGPVRNEVLAELVEGRRPRVSPSPTVRGPSTRPGRGPQRSGDAWTWPEPSSAWSTPAPPRPARSQRSAGRSAVCTRSTTAGPGVTRTPSAHRRTRQPRRPRDAVRRATRLVAGPRRPRPSSPTPCSRLGAAGGEQVGAAQHNAGRGGAVRQGPLAVRQADGRSRPSSTDWPTLMVDLEHPARRPITRCGL